MGPANQVTRVQLELSKTLLRLGRTRPAAQEAADPANLAKGPALAKAPLRLQGALVGCALRKLGAAGRGRVIGGDWRARRAAGHRRPAAPAPLIHPPPSGPSLCGRQCADIQLVVVNSEGKPLASYDLGERLLSAAWLNPVGGELVVTQVQSVKGA